MNVLASFKVKGWGSHCPVDNDEASLLHVLTRRINTQKPAGILPHGQTACCDGDNTPPKMHAPNNV
jgi:hypothetical protein